MANRFQQFVTQQATPGPSAWPGMVEAGNIDLAQRPVVQNPDGSISTVRSISANFDGREYLIPTVSDDGRVMSDDEAIATFRKSGKHLGAFDKPENATAFAERLHNDQARQHGDKPKNRFSRFAPLAQPRTFDRDEDETLYREELAKEQERRATAVVPMGLQGRDERGQLLYDQTPEEAAIGTVQRQRGTEAEQREFDASRTPFRRVMDTSTFALSLPIRMLTRGQYGLGDVAGLLSSDAKGVYDRAEADFARANAPGLEAAKAGGEIMAGIPALSTMGAIPGGIAATGSAFANRPFPQSAIPRAMVRNDRLADIEAFQQSGVKPFGPALTEAGTAGAVKQLSEAPIVGAPVRKALTEAVEQTRDAGDRLAARYGDAKSYRDVGNVVEGGLERFRDAKAADLGDDAARRLADDTLADIAARPARETSINTKQDALYERAWRGIPEDMQKGRSKKSTERFWGGFTKTQELLKEITERNQRMFMVREGKKAEAAPETPMMPGMGGNYAQPKPAAAAPAQDPRLAYPVRGGIPGRIVEDIVEGRWRGNLQSMRNVRSEFRRLVSGMADTEKNTLNISDMRRVQSAMTEDMITLLERNAEFYAGKKGGAATAARVRRAIHDFRRADQFTRASVGRIEMLEKLYGAQSAEQLALGVVKDAMGGRKGGNFARLSALRRSLADDEWGDVSAGVLREMGKPIGSARGVAEDAGFSVQSFITNYRNMSPEGRDAMFNRVVDGKNLRPELERFVRVADRMANFEALANTSRGTTNALGITGLASIFAAAQQAMTGNFQTAAAAASIAGGTYAFGKFMTSPAYVRWLTRAAELSGDPGKLLSLRSHARELARLAEKEPDQAVQNLVHVLAMKLGDATSEPAREQR